MGELFLSIDLAPRMVIEELEVTPDAPPALILSPATLPWRAFTGFTAFVHSISVVDTFDVA